MTANNIVIFGTARFEFPSPERAADARYWLVQRGGIATPASFFANFPDAKPAMGPLGGTAAPG